ncbi:hypothetical protein [Silanimonas sp.]|uniref:hypothetical protein n=1 Tax=Silanimonas sp. TaxID=1929290 RepID=UPI00261F149C|nr:hypothetical protein [Silanimonas sp.]
MRFAQVILAILLAASGGKANAYLDLECGHTLDFENRDPSAEINDIAHLRSTGVRSIKEYYQCEVDERTCKTGWSENPTTYDFDRAGRLVSSRKSYDLTSRTYRYVGDSRFPSESRQGEHREIYERTPDGTLVAIRFPPSGERHRKLWSKQGDTLVVQSPEGQREFYQRAYLNGRHAWEVSEGMPTLNGSRSPRTRSECDFATLDSGHLQIDTYEMRGGSRVLSSREVLDERSRPVFNWMLSLNPEQASRNLGIAVNRSYLDFDGKANWTRMTVCRPECVEVKRDIQYW